MSVEQRRLYLVQVGAEMRTPEQLTLSLQPADAPESEKWMLVIFDPRPELASLLSAHGIDIEAPLPVTIGRPTWKADDGTE